MSTVFKLFSSKDNALLIRRNPLLMLYTFFELADGGVWIDENIQGFTSQRLYCQLYCCLCLILDFIGIAYLYNSIEVDLEVLVIFILTLFTHL